jgi:hypothetical protein
MPFLFFTDIINTKGVVVRRRIAVRIEDNNTFADAYNFLKRVEKSLPDASDYVVFEDGANMFKLSENVKTSLVSSGKQINCVLVQPPNTPAVIPAPIKLIVSEALTLTDTSGVILSCSDVKVDVSGNNVSVSTGGMSRSAVVPGNNQASVRVATARAAASVAKANNFVNGLASSSKPFAPNVNAINNPGATAKANVARGKSVVVNTDTRVMQKILADRAAAANTLAKKNGITVPANVPHWIPRDLSGGVLPTNKSTWSTWETARPRNMPALVEFSAVAPKKPTNN